MNPSLILPRPMLSLFLILLLERCVSMPSNYINDGMIDDLIDIDAVLENEVEENDRFGGGAGASDMDYFEANEYGSGWKGDDEDEEDAHRSSFNALIGEETFAVSSEAGSGESGDDEETLSTRPTRTKTRLSTTAPIEKSTTSTSLKSTSFATSTRRALTEPTPSTNSFKHRVNGDAEESDDDLDDVVEGSGDESSYTESSITTTTISETTLAPTEHVLHKSSTIEVTTERNQHHAHASHGHHHISKHNHHNSESHNAEDQDSKTTHHKKTDNHNNHHKKQANEVSHSHTEEDIKSDASLSNSVLSKNTEITTVATNDDSTTSATTTTSRKVKALRDSSQAEPSSTSTSPATPTEGNAANITNLILFWTQPWMLAVVVGGAVIVILFVILLSLVAVYKIKTSEKDVLDFNESFNPKIIAYQMTKQSETWT